MAVKKEYLKADLMVLYLAWLMADQSVELKVVWKELSTAVN